MTIPKKTSSRYLVLLHVENYDLRTAHTKIVEGNLVVAERWYFVARFCFLSEQGQFEYFIEYSKEYAVQNLLLYYDAESQWPSVYKSQKYLRPALVCQGCGSAVSLWYSYETCEEKESALHVNQNQIINLTDAEYGSGCIQSETTQYGSSISSEKNYTPVIKCHNAKRFHSARPRWWFLAVSHCNATNGLNLRYKFLMTNGLPGDIWKEHFSADEYYILPLLTVFFVMYLILLIATAVCTTELRSRQLLHSTYKLFTFSILLEEMGITMQCMDCMRYAYDGIGFPTIKTLGRMSESTSEICFLLLLLLLAKGYTVTRGRLRLASSVKLTVFMCAYSITTVGLYIFEQHVFDPGEVLYLYESPAGYGLMFLRIAAWWIFEYSTMFTLKHYPQKSNFYYPFNVMGTLWFVAGPCFALIANSLIDKWIRESIVCAMYHLIAFSGHALFFLLTMPSKANKNFPYHVRTSQIDVMEDTSNTGNNSNNLDNFGHHPYAPYAPSIAMMMVDGEDLRIGPADVPVDLFSVKHKTITKSMESVNRPDQTMSKSLLAKKQEISSDLNPSSSPASRLPETSENRRQNSAPDIATTDSVFPTDTFIAPALRDERVLSA